MSTVELPRQHTSTRWAGLRIRPLVSLAGLGLLLLPVYGLALAHGTFRPKGIEAFFPIFGAAFAIYALAVRRVLRQPAHGHTLRWVFGFALLFNLLLLPMWPTLSDDMFRYVWDGRVQAAGFNPYRYASDSPQFANLRDDTIWPEMNRPKARTVYPPGTQVVFALTWRLFPDSVIGMKLVMIAFTLGAGSLLAMLLNALGDSPARALIFLWHPLLIFEIAHSAHADALYLPFLVAAFYVRAIAPPDRVSQRHEIGIGVLLGLATLMKLYPILLAAPLWSIRTTDGVRRWRPALPLALVGTIAAGYALYIAPGVDTLGFLSQYSREFFNIGPLPNAIIQWTMQRRLPYYRVIQIAMPALVVLVSLYFWLRPAHTAREAILRCAWPAGIYLMVNMNLHAWYVLLMLPLVALDLGKGINAAINAALAWWLFSGLVALAYVFFIDWEVHSWAIALQFWPLYVLLALAALLRIRETWLNRHRGEYTP